MQKAYIYFSVDSSFDYNGPFGTKTCQEKEWNGFNITFDENNKPILSSIEGFGDMENVEDYKTSWEDFLKYLEDSEKYITDEDKDDTPRAVFDELKESVKKITKGNKLCKTQ